MKTRKSTHCKFIELETSTLINKPQHNTIYYKKINHNPDTVVAFRIEATPTNRLQSFCINSLSYTDFDGYHHQMSGYEDGFSFESTFSLPLNLAHLTSYPLIFYCFEEQRLFYAIEAHIQITPYYSCYSIPNFDEINKIEVIGEQISKNCQQLVGNIPVITSKHPIYKPCHLPTIETLINLYQQFIKYNYSKLTYQTVNTAAHCHVRAHFISLLLSYYGIDSVKVFQYWHLNQWKNFPNNSSWGFKWKFHCAVMIETNIGFRVWDPWAGLNKTLLTLTEWARTPHRPLPIKLKISNRCEIFKKHELLNLEYGWSCNYYRSLQALVGSAVPNGPRKNPSLGMFRPFNCNTLSEHETLAEIDQCSL